MRKTTREAWLNFLSPASRRKLKTLLKEIESLEGCFPEAEHRLKAFDFFPPEQTKLVLLGQDPYHQKGQAMGLAFSVPQGMKIPPSLRNIFKELEQSFGQKRENPDLSDWAEQGVLLLNRSLSVLENQAGSHEKLGWHPLTQELLENFSKAFPHCPFMLLGAQARKLKNSLSSVKIFEAEHPSPLSAYRGFLGSGVFKACDNYYLERGLEPIDWLGPIEIPHRLPL